MHLGTLCVNWIIKFFVFVNLDFVFIYPVLTFKCPYQIIHSQFYWICIYSFILSYGISTSQIYRYSKVCLRLLTGLSLFGSQCSCPCSLCFKFYKINYTGWKYIRQRWILYIFMALATPRWDIINLIFRFFKVIRNMISKC